MSNPLLRSIIRTRFTLTTRAGASEQARKALTNYLKLAQGLSEVTGSQSITVPRMTGVDEDMRGWSFFMLLRHNTIASNAISANIRRLARGEPAPTKKFDIKNDVMPEPDSGIEQIAIFKSSVLTHLEAVKELGELRGTQATIHPLFGPFDAHKWHCMFAFHLQIHLKQAAYLKLHAVKPLSP